MTISAYVRNSSARRRLHEGPLRAGVDSSVIAIWLGHEPVQTTQVHIDAQIALKEAVLEKITPLARSKSGINLATNFFSFSTRCRLIDYAERQRQRREQKEATEQGSDLHN